MISLDAYRSKKSSLASASVARARLTDLSAPQPSSHLADHRVAFLAAAEQQSARALCLLLNNRPISAGLHHLSAMLFRHYAESDAMTRLACISAHLVGHPATTHSVHINTTQFFHATIEAFYREHAKEIQGNLAGHFSLDDAALDIVALFLRLGYEARYNAIIATYNASIGRSDEQDQHLLKRQYMPASHY